MNEPLKPKHLSAELFKTITSTVSEGTKIKGSIKSGAKANVGLRVDGEIHGDIVLGEGSMLHVGPTGRIVGSTVEVDYLFNEGFVESATLSQKAVELSASSSTNGKLTYHGVLCVVPLAKIQGALTFGG